MLKENNGKIPANNLCQVIIIISGLVQGVYFRAHTRRQALNLGLIGYAKNLADGRVEVKAAGHKNNLEKLIAWCHQGPPAARVESVTWECQPFDLTDNIFIVI